MHHCCTRYWTSQYGKDGLISLSKVCINLTIKINFSKITRFFLPRKGVSYRETYFACLDYRNVIFKAQENKIWYLKQSGREGLIQLGLFMRCLTSFQSEGDIFISSPVCKYAAKYPHWSCITKLLPEKHHLSSLIPHWLEVTVRKLPISYLLCQVNCDEFLPWNIKDYPWISLLQSVNDCEYWFWNIKKRP